MAAEAAARQTAARALPPRRESGRRGGPAASSQASGTAESRELWRAASSSRPPRRLRGRRLLASSRQTWKLCLPCGSLWSRDGRAACDGSARHASLLVLLGSLSRCINTVCRVTFLNRNAGRARSPRIMPTHFVQDTHQRAPRQHTLVLVQLVGRCRKSPPHP